MVLQDSWPRHPSASWRLCLGIQMLRGCTVWPKDVTQMRQVPSLLHGMSRALFLWTLFHIGRPGGV